MTLFAGKVAGLMTGIGLSIAAASSLAGPVGQDPKPPDEHTQVTRVCRQRPVPQLLRRLPRDISARGWTAGRQAEEASAGPHAVLASARRHISRRDGDQHHRRPPPRARARWARHAGVGRRVQGVASRRRRSRGKGANRRTGALHRVAAGEAGRVNRSAAVQRCCSARCSGAAVLRCCGAAVQRCGGAGCGTAARRHGSTAARRHGGTAALLLGAHGLERIRLGRPPRRKPAGRKACQRGQ